MSQWGANDRPPRFTQDVVRQWALARQHKFFTHLVQAISGKHRPRSGWDAFRRRCWKNVTFLHVIPGVPAGSARQRPSPLGDDAGAAAFNKHPSQATPDLDICGYRPAHDMPERMGSQIQAMIYQPSDPSCAGNVFWRRKGSVLFTSMYPSRNLSSTKEHAELVAMAKGAGLFDRYRRWLNHL